MNTTTATACPAWCASEHTNPGDATLHDSPTIVTGHAATTGTTMTAQLVRLDPEPGCDTVSHETWVTVGDYSLEIGADQMSAFARQLRELAAAVELLCGQVGGAR